MLTPPIGCTSDKAFKANYNGGGKSITHLQIDGGANPYSISGTYRSIGLFGYANGATIKNLTVSGNIRHSRKDINTGGILGESTGENVTITNCVSNINIYNKLSDAATNYGTGGILGKANSACSITGCTSNANITDSLTSTINIGGVVGLNSNDNTTISKCKFTGVISSPSVGGGTPCMGGICGKTSNGIEITNCKSLNTASISTSHNSSQAINISGILAYIDASSKTVKIKHCKNEGTLNANDATSCRVGGILGASANVSKIEVDSDTNSRGLSCKGRLGGIVGYVYGSGTIEIDSCINTGSLSEVGTGGLPVGGILGHSTNAISKISNCKNSISAEISGSGNVGGIIGQNATSGSFVKYCYNAGAISSTGSNTGGIAGEFGYADIQQCHNIGRVTGSSINIGGILGKTGRGTITKCRNDAVVKCTRSDNTKDNAVGGILGYAYGTAAEDAVSVINCGMEGDSVIAAGKETGGVVGYARCSAGTTVKNCYASCVIKSVGVYAGGIVGYNNGTSVTIENNYFNGKFSQTTGCQGEILYATTGTVNISSSYVVVNSGRTYSGAKSNATGYFNTDGTYNNGTFYEGNSTLGNALRAWQKDNDDFLAWQLTENIPTLDWTGIFIE